jgi:hypothetical protein
MKVSEECHWGRKEEGGMRRWRRWRREERKDDGRGKREGGGYLKYLYIRQGSGRPRAHVEFICEYSVLLG